MMVFYGAGTMCAANQKDSMKSLVSMVAITALGMLFLFTPEWLSGKQDQTFLMRSLHSTKMKKKDNLSSAS